MCNSKNPNSKKYYVYEWYIKDTGEVFYIGKGCRERWKTKSRENKFFCNMVKTHDCDVRKIYEGLTEVEAYELEIKTISYYRENTSCRLTNVLDGGDNPPTFYGEDSPTKRPEVKAKISKANKAIWKDEDYRNKMKKVFSEFYKTPKGQIIASKRSKTNWNNNEIRNKIILSLKAATQSEEYRKAKSCIMKKSYESAEVREKITGKNNGASRIISQYDIEGNYIATFETLTEAEKKTGYSLKNISKVLRGHRKTAYGFVWKFSDNKQISYKKRQPYDKDINRNKKSIIQYDLNNNFVKEYDSVASAAKENKYSHHSNIISNLKGRTKTAYGFVWKYKD